MDRLQCGAAAAVTLAQPLLVQALQVRQLPVLLLLLLQ
jgi:hypothetical protein